MKKNNRPGRIYRPSTYLVGRFKLLLKKFHRVLFFQYPTPLSLKKKQLRGSFVVVIILFISMVTVPFATYALSIVVRVPEKYTDVEAGERFYFNIEIKYPENPSRSDLRLFYEITKDDKLVAQAKVLKAVETQASFIDFIVLPESAKKGLYILNVTVEDYTDLKEEVSASFHVIGSKGNEIRIYFFILLGVIIFFGIFFGVQIFIKRERAKKLTRHDYSDIPKGKRVFYEMISDTITQMQYRVGSKALTIAKEVSGLKINEDNGKVLNITEDPAKVVSSLVLKFEEIFDKKVSFASRETGGKGVI